MRDAEIMCTTLALDDDILEAAKEIAERRGTTAGRVVSDLVRQALEAPAPRARLRNGVPLVARRPGSRLMTMTRVNELRDDGVTRRALLDVNVLIALFDPGHVHHDAAHDWFADNRARGWATCPISENGFVRILANPTSGIEMRLPGILKSLRTFCASGYHAFWPDAVSLRDDMFDLSFAPGHRQLTDVYLLGLAVRNNGRLATFDQGIPLKAVKGARRDMLAIITPD